MTIATSLPPAVRPMDKLEAIDLDFFYGANQVLFSISVSVLERQITALIGPSGCGKSTFLRCLNRMNDTIAGTRAQGQILLDGKDILDPAMNVVEQMLQLHKRLAAASERDRELYQRQIDATDQEIDRLVYNLYGLMENECSVAVELMRP